MNSWRHEVKADNSAARVHLTASPPASSFTVLTAQAFERFLHQPWDHEEGRHRVGSPPTRQGVATSPNRSFQERYERASVSFASARSAALPMDSPTRCPGARGSSWR